MSPPSGFALWALAFAATTVVSVGFLFIIPIALLKCDHGLCDCGGMDVSEAGNLNHASRVADSEDPSTALAVGSLRSG